MSANTPFDISGNGGIAEFFGRLFTNDFMPRGHCYFWRPEILWLHVLSDAGIALAYYMIPVALFIFASRRKDVPFHWMFFMFAAFIGLCGTTHLMGIMTQWEPLYRLEGIIKLVTAAVSLTAAFVLLPVIPRALELPNTRRLNSELKQKAEHLTRINAELVQFSLAATGREERIIELKKEINALSREAGREPPYDLSFLNLSEPSGTPGA